MVYKRFFRAAVVLMAAGIVALAAGCSDPAGHSEPGNTAAAEPSASPDASPAVPAGETKRYSYQNLEVELTNVKSDRTETMTDDGGNPWTYVVITYYPGATLTVIHADMSDPAYAEDGKAHPQWGIDGGERIDLSNDTQLLGLTPDMAGVYNLEASLYVFRFEPYAG